MSDDIKYWLDNDNYIFMISGPWDRFAQDNAGADSQVANVLGNKLEIFIADDDTRKHINALISSVRDFGKTVEREYRCDSPEEKRYLKMIISREEDNTIQMVHQLLRVEDKEVVINYTTLTQNSREANASSTKISRCSQCNRIKLSSIWLEDQEELVLSQLPSDNQFSVIYTVCEDCRLS